MDLLQDARQEINEVDKEMAKLFVRRMNAVAKVAKYKQEHGLPVFDGAREAQVITRNSQFVEDEELRAFYINFLQNTMEVSKKYQRKAYNGSCRCNGRKRLS